MAKLSLKNDAFMDQFHEFSLEDELAKVVREIPTQRMCDGLQDTEEFLDKLEAMIPKDEVRFRLWFQSQRANHREMMSGLTFH